jgi:adenosyl cobinamide kinase/adenosyl cobinamide phosphate guanylyltransferase
MTEERKVISIKMTDKEQRMKSGKEELKEVTLSMELLKLIAQYYGIPLMAFFSTEEEIREWIQKHGTADRVTWKYYDAIKKIKEIVDELSDEKKP